LKTVFLKGPIAQNPPRMPNAA